MIGNAAKTIGSSREIEFLKEDILNGSKRAEILIGGGASYRDARNWVAAAEHYRAATAGAPREFFFWSAN